MGRIDEALELRADEYEEMIRVYKEMKYKEILKEMRNNEKNI